MPDRQRNAQKMRETYKNRIREEAKEEATEEAFRDFANDLEYFVRKSGSETITMLFEQWITDLMAKRGFTPKKD